MHITVVELHELRIKTANIVPTTDLFQRIVYRVVTHFKETEATVDRPQSDHPTTVILLKNIKTIYC